MHLKIHEEIVIKCSEHAAFEIVSVPTNWPAFVHKIETLNYNNGIYRGTIKMGRRKGEFTGKLADSAKSNTIELCITFCDIAGNLEIATSIIYKIFPNGDSVKITEDIWYKHHINILVWIVIKCIQKFGWSAESSNLENLKELLEMPKVKASA